MWSLAQSPYEVTNDVTVESGATLTIEPGVAVYFDPATNLIVGSGALRALGTAGAPIMFTSVKELNAASPAPGDWGALRFLPGTIAATTIVEHAQIRYGNGISIQSASPTLNYLAISDNAGPAISMDLQSSPVGVGLQATRNTINGIVIPAGDIQSSVAWGLKGIPYVVSQGIVSVGQRPSISNVTPNEIEQGTTVDVLVNGVRLAGVESLAVGHPDGTATILSGGTAAYIPVRFTATENATLGSFSMDLQTAAGKLRLENGLSVIAPRPTTVLSVYPVPNPLATLPDNLQREFFLRLSAPQTVDRSFSISVQNTAIATVSPTVINFAPGQTLASLTIAGHAAGQTTLDITSSSLSSPLEFPIYVTTDYAKMNFTHGKVIGIVKGDPTTPTTSQPGNPVVSLTVGLVKGDATLPPTANPGNPVTSTVVGVVKGDSTLPPTQITGNPVTSTVIGIVKGDSTLPLVSTPAGLVTSGVVGVTK